jgi:hypothetical protein
VIIDLFIGVALDYNPDPAALVIVLLHGEQDLSNQVHVSLHFSLSLELLLKFGQSSFSAAVAASPPALFAMSDSHDLPVVTIRRSEICDVRLFTFRHSTDSVSEGRTASQDRPDTSPSFLVQRERVFHRTSAPILAKTQAVENVP